MHLLRLLTHTPVPPFLPAQAAHEVGHGVAARVKGIRLKVPCVALCFGSCACMRAYGCVHAQHLALPTHASALLLGVRLSISSPHPTIVQVLDSEPVAGDLWQHPAAGLHGQIEA